MPRLFCQRQVKRRREGYRTAKEKPKALLRLPGGVYDADARAVSAGAYMGSTKLTMPASRRHIFMVSGIVWLQFWKIFFLVAVYPAGWKFSEVSFGSHFFGCFPQGYLFRRSPGSVSRANHL